MQDVAELRERVGPSRIVETDAETVESAADITESQSNYGSAHLSQFIKSNFRRSIHHLRVAINNRVVVSPLVSGNGPEILDHVAGDPPVDPRCHVDDPALNAGGRCRLHHLVQ